jgi:predicted HTH transcriptional regulator
MEINEIIKYGETQTVEFKKSMSQMKEGCKALCGMLNTIALSGQRPRYIPLYEYDGRAFIKEGSIKRILSLQEKQSLLKRRDRASHNGPWVCDKCGSWVAMLSSIKFTAEGPKKSYDCKCGGEFWPAT